MRNSKFVFRCDGHAAHPSLSLDEAKSESEKREKSEKREPEREREREKTDGENRRPLTLSPPSPVSFSQPLKKQKQAIMQLSAARSVRPARSSTLKCSAIKAQTPYADELIATAVSERVWA